MFYFVKKIGIMAIIFLAGCATPQKYNNELNNMVGDNAAQLKMKFGNPSAKKIFGDGAEIWTYTKVNDVYVPSEFYLYNQGALSNEYNGLFEPFMEQYDFSPYEQNFGYDVKYFCQTSFLLEKQKIIGWKWRGNNCVAQ